MIGTMTLTEFLLARIAEDEDAAEATLDWQEAEDGSRWTTSEAAVYGSDGMCLAGNMGGPTGEHVVRWDPTRVLAECEAKRRIVAEFIRPPMGRWSKNGEPTPYGDRLLALLALPYAAHPDYDEAWRP